MVVLITHICGYVLLVPVLRTREIYQHFRGPGLYLVFGTIVLSLISALLKRKSSTDPSLERILKHTDPHGEVLHILLRYRLGSLTICKYRAFLYTKH